MQFISLGQVLEHIDSGKPFDIEVVKADVTRGTGGEIRSYQRCVKYMNQELNKKASAEAAALTSAPKRPNHYENSTKNIYLTSERRVVKIHNRLIVRFNGIAVS